MVVNHARGLHQCVRGGGPDEPETALLEVPGHGLGLPAHGGHLRQGSGPGTRRRGIGPQQVGEVHVEVGLAEAVNALVGDPEKARRFGQAGRQRCIDEFSWAHIAEQTLEIYRKVSA